MCASYLWFLLLYMHAEHFYNQLPTTSHNYFLKIRIEKNWSGNYYYKARPKRVLSCRFQ